MVAPTRELALQVSRELTWLYAGTGATVSTCVGGMDPSRERRALYQGAHIVVGTPGRVMGTFPLSPEDGGLGDSAQLS